MELNLSKKKGFWNTFWNIHKDFIIKLGNIFVVLLIVIYVVYGLFCLRYYSLGYRNVLTIIGFYSLCAILGIMFLYIISLIIFFIVSEIIKIKLLQTVPITKEEFQSFGCKSQEDVIICLILNRYFYVGKYQMCFEYPDYMIDDIRRTTESFPSVLNKEEIELLDEKYKGPFSLEYVLEQRKSGLGLSSNWDRCDYEILRKYITPELLPIYEKQYNQIKI
ncbi:hypothetical protein DW886_16850 [Enterocloster aldenensis]|uniref:hypothetical protein n=1 Tax=Enterocloster aldenensis TaxID=358742 RepID=UPI000E492772|nr:hypothetical protein DW886_16850 [Enterocloster aldenensis]